MWRRARELSGMEGIVVANGVWVDGVFAFIAEVESWKVRIQKLSFVHCVGSKTTNLKSPRSTLARVCWVNCDGP